MTTQPTAMIPEQFFTEVRTALFMHAHPDDESLWAGNLMAELVDRGARVALITANRGERGQVVDAEFAHLFGTDGLGRRRTTELAGAIAALGVSEHTWLGTAPARAAGLPDREYGDSGMRWVAEGIAGPDLEAAADPRCFTSADIAEPVADLAAAVEAIRPDAIITYDEEGGYGHPDHVRAHEIAVAAGRAAGVPVWAIVPDIGRDGIGAVDVWFELPHQAERVRAALRSHRTQLVMLDDGMVRHEDGFTHATPQGVGLRLLPGSR